MDGSRGGRQAWARSAAAVLGNGIWAEPPTPKILSHFQTSSKGCAHSDCGAGSLPPAEG
ncbi:hypothetical protein IscW_ISCW008551 [Ixodes scapularis]|uniref:Uncharacterized protein n=1 Tax=Ixodes scapularis TaxID=6945 RepID=B7Q336_IXOSC|nr:hypothetical protein IscW_ISCW008551 [Ixodes scapularis]|eukprot:XP_002411134.1 hypothetical protein IscW_ISCW008551 [Ixodes scapularis]